MSNVKTKKLPLLAKITILLSVLAIVFLSLSIISASYSVSRTVDAIDAIGEVEYTEESKEKIDLALSYYASLDRNLGLDEKITNFDNLTAAKREYVRLGIKRAYLADKNGEAEDIVKQYVAEARQSFNEYCSTGECTNISNYKDLTDLEEKYASDSTPVQDNSSPAESSKEEEIELC